MVETVTVKKDQFLFEQGDEADCMYIVKSGKMNLIISDGIKENVIDTATMGQLFGEMSLFDKKNRSASAKAVIDTVLVKLPYKKLEEELIVMPEWVQATLKTLCEKIREANLRVLSKS